MAEAEKHFRVLVERIDKLSERWRNRYAMLYEYRADIGEIASWSNSYQKAFSEILNDARRLYDAKKISYDQYALIYEYVHAHIDAIKEETKMIIDERLEKTAEMWKKV